MLLFHHSSTVEIEIETMVMILGFNGFETFMSTGFKVERRFAKVLRAQIAKHVFVSSTGMQGKYHATFFAMMAICNGIFLSYSFLIS